MVVARAAESKGVAAKGAAATKVAKGVAAKALEGVALHLRPDAMAQPVINEGEVGRGRRRVLGWAQGGCGAGHTIGGSTFRRAGSQGGRGELPGSGVVARKNVGLVRSIRYLGEFAERDHKLRTGVP